MERRAIVVRGIVQGVGFRPFVFHLASQLGLTGFVKNEAGVVRIEVEGETVVLDEFVLRLQRDAPVLAHIEGVSWESRPFRGERIFRIEASDAGREGGILVAADAAVCADCLREMFDPADRRYLYPFLNCTQCGPRLTIIEGAPYDRVHTTMARFEMCAACRAEYEDPANRRFHAQPTACAACGPTLSYVESNGQRARGNEALSAFAKALQVGKIGAIKGIGGYHLTCIACDEEVVETLRRRKQRDDKPFALMVRDLESVKRLCVLGDGEAELLASSACPIVLLRCRPGNRVAAAVAPDNPRLGVMLPHAPLHHLLFHALGDMPLVMTSGNTADEPIAYEDADASSRLEGIADVFLTHDRPIRVRCDDSVSRVVDGQELPLRRSRGYAPHPIALGFRCPCPMLAVGGQLKSTFALGYGSNAIVSHHLGDLDHYAAYRAFERDIALYEQLFAVTPALLVHDAHPDYASTRYAQARGIPTLAVQHHHAHLASCMAEHGLRGPVIGVTFDGAGHGADGTVWGGEFLVGDYRDYRRVGHFGYVGMPGGEQAIREPWRMTLAHARHAGCSHRLEGRIAASKIRLATALLERGFNSPRTSSVGRLFDAVAALAGVRDCVTYEGQAALELEWLAERVSPCGAYPYVLAEGEPFTVDTRSTIRAIAVEAAGTVSPSDIARRFHTTLVEIIAAACERIRTTTMLSEVVLSGGVFANGLLGSETSKRLAGAGFHVYRHRKAPPGDGGLSLGQLAIAAHSSR